MIIYLIIYLLYLLFKFYYTFITKFITQKLFLFSTQLFFLSLPSLSKTRQTLSATVHRRTRLVRSLLRTAKAPRSRSASVQTISAQKRHQGAPKLRESARDPHVQLAFSPLIRPPRFSFGLPLAWPYLVVLLATHLEADRCRCRFSSCSCQIKLQFNFVRRR